jgi:hypothetical protein
MSSCIYCCRTDFPVRKSDAEVSTFIMVFLGYGFDVGRSMIMLLKLIGNLSISL